jgi:phenylpropionate dioxygenase-like ring-hydroxylating dioxygenase large terminal subunit
MSNKITRRDITFTSLAFGAAMAVGETAKAAGGATAAASSGGSVSKGESRGAPRYPKGFKEGTTIPAEHYLEESWYAREEAYLRDNYWWLVDHESRIPKAGDFFVFKFGRGESVVIARADDGSINGFHNVCRHRGSRLCMHNDERPTEAGPGGQRPDNKFSIRQLGEEGNTSVFRCPYHAWVYDLKGKLVSVPANGNPKGFKLEDHHAHTAPVRVVDGFIFVSLAVGSEPKFEIPTGEVIHPKMKIAARKSLPTKANWKLVLENFTECYHCAHAHTNSYIKPVWRAEQTLTRAQFEAIAAEAKKQGKDYGTYEAFLARYDNPERFMEPRTQPGYSGGTSFLGRPGRNQDLRPGYEAYTLDGKPAVSMLLDGAEKGVNLGAQVGGMRRGLNGLVYHGDYATIYRFTPLAPDLTDVELIWLVHPDAKEGVDYEVDHLTGLWTNVYREDRWLAENNHSGLRSSRYRFNGVGQPYMQTELKGPGGFANWYMAEMVPAMLRADKA